MTNPDPVPDSVAPRSSMDTTDGRTFAAMAVYERGTAAGAATGAADELLRTVVSLAKCAPTTPPPMPPMTAPTRRSATALLRRPGRGRSEAADAGGSLGGGAENSVVSS